MNIMNSCTIPNLGRNRQTTVFQKPLFLHDFSVAVTPSPFGAYNRRISGFVSLHPNPASQVFRYARDDIQKFASRPLRKPAAPLGDIAKYLSSIDFCKIDNLHLKLMVVA